MVLAPVKLVTALVGSAFTLGLVAGCNQSLFDANSGADAATTDGSSDGAVPTSCPAGCIADAAGDYDGSPTPTGTGGQWRYLDDHRDRTWSPMTAGTDGLVGLDASNRVTTCAANPTAPACAALPGALLVSTAGASSAADPALEFTVDAQQVIQLTVRVHVPAGAVAQGVRLYRSSREDALMTAIATAGTTLDLTLEVDALAGDRFLVALAPGALGAEDIAVHVFANVTGATFPQTCQMAVTFGAAVGNTVTNPCNGGGDLTHNQYNQDNSSTPVAPVLAAGPFPELGMAADIAPDHYYRGTMPMLRPGDVTIQMWIHLDALDPTYAAWPFSDEDLDLGGGLALALYDIAAPKLAAESCKDPNNVTVDETVTPWPASGWHFVRLVRTGSTVAMCLDGTRVGMMTLTLGRIDSSYSPYFGKNVRWTPAGAFFDGQIDDIRMFSTALPCE